MLPAEIEIQNDRMYFNFPYNKTLLEEIKNTFEGRKYHGYDEHNPRKIWSAPITPRNCFRLEDLRDKYGCRPYQRYDNFLKLKDFGLNTKRPLRDYQREGVIHGLITKGFIWAYHMGLGKTLMAITLMELSGYKDWIWVAPKSALKAADLEFEKWNALVTPEFHTYDSAKKLVANWPSGKTAPQGLICDEASKCKTPTAQRTVAIKHLADSIRSDHPENWIVGLLSGTPAPKSPADWWSLCEIACPGFIIERDIFTFRQRLGIIEERDGGAGVYPHLVSWKDDETKCNKCGKPESDVVHATVFGPDTHAFQKSVNEVAGLKKRMAGLVLVKMKQDCLSLPDKIYQEIVCKPSDAMLQAAELIKAKSTRAIEALTLLRELSDGFQYKDVPDGKELCPVCNGKKQTTIWFDPDSPDGWVDPYFLERGKRPIYDADFNFVEEVDIVYQSKLGPCTHCFETGEVDRFVRTTIDIGTPKDEALLDEIELHEEVGRLVTYAGFTASIDRVVGLYIKSGWSVIRVDGRGWIGITPTGEHMPKDDLLKIFQHKQELYPKVGFVGHPGSAGMGLTLTASPTNIFYSNDFNGENREQAEDRIHRIGMDENRGATIKDIINLPTDRYIIENLKVKRELQKLSMVGVRNYR